MGITKDGRLTVSDNEGNWMPSSKVSLIKKGGFYGYVQTNTKKPVWAPDGGKIDPKKVKIPETFDQPLVWLPQAPSPGLLERLVAPQEPGGPVLVVPLPGGRAQLGEEGHVLSIRLDPASEHRPARDEGLVNDLERRRLGLGVDDDQACGHESVDHPLHGVVDHAVLGIPAAMDRGFPDAFRPPMIGVHQSGRVDLQAEEWPEKEGAVV